jgi:hypothetical protein
MFDSQTLWGVCLAAQRNGGFAEFTFLSVPL